MINGAREKLFAARVQEVLRALASQWPSMSVTVDLWRPSLLTNDPAAYIDDQDEVWVRLDEGVSAFFVQTTERWYQKEEGVIRTNFNWLILPAGLNVRADDHVIFQSESWLVLEAAEQAGVLKIKIDKQKSRFVNPARTTPAYRQMLMRTKIL